MAEDLGIGPVVALHVRSLLPWRLLTCSYAVERLRQRLSLHVSVWLCREQVVGGCAVRDAVFGL